MSLALLRNYGLLIIPKSEIFDISQKLLWRSLILVRGKSMKFIVYERAITKRSREVVNLQQWILYLAEDIM